MLEKSFSIFIVWSPVPLSAVLVTLKLSCSDAPLAVPSSLLHIIANPCARLVVAEPPSLSTVKPFVKLVNGTIIPYAYGLSPRVAVSQADLSFAIVAALSIADAPGASLNAFFLFTEAVLAELSSASKAFI